MIKRIKVTEQHIKNGTKKHCCECPVALAIAEHSARPKSVRVYNDSVRSISFWEGYSFPNLESWMPTFVGDFIHHFDRGDPVTPFEFDLDIPESVLPEES